MDHFARSAFERKVCLNILPGQKNIVISPYSAGVVTAMIMAASAKNTQKQICDAIGIDAECEKEFMLQHSTTGKALNKGGEPVKQEDEDDDRGVLLRIANSLWADGNVEDAYKTVCIDVFKAEVLTLDTKDTINEWVANKTQGNILDLLKDDPKGPAVLVNAVFFKGRFESAFEKDKTCFTEFYPDYQHDSPGEATMVDTMCKKEYMRYLKHKAAEIVELPYANSNFSLLIVLPSPSYTTTGALNALIGEWNDVRNGMYNAFVHLEVPKCSLKYDLSLIPVMEDMGIKEVFSPTDASLDRLMKKEPGAYIKLMMQACTFDLDEEGVTAAAATVAVAGTRGGGGFRKPEHIEVLVNRPHLMFVIENDLNVILFAGVVNNPKVN